MATPDYTVETTPPAARRPPIVQTGALGWLRANLFSSWWNSLLTVVSAVALAWALVSFVQWTTQQANWAVITNNLHLFSLGRYPPDQAWRPAVGTGVLLFLIGASWRLWGRAAWGVLAAALIAVALVFLLPAAAANLPQPDTYILIGGPTSEPLPALAYVVRAGETVTFSLQPVDFSQAAPAGFMDTNSLTVYGLGRQAYRAAERQRERAIEAGETPPPIPEPDLVASVSVLDANGEMLGTLSAGPEPAPQSLDVTFSADGWVLIVPEGEGEVGGYLLEVSAISPLPTASTLVARRDAQVGPPPELEGKRVRVMDITLLGFQGLETFSDFTKLHLGPFAAALRDVLLFSIVVTAGGYGAGALVRKQPWARRAALIAWLISPIAILVLLRGIDGVAATPIVEPERWGGLLLTLLLTVVGIIAAFPIGVLLALGRRSNLPVVRVFCTLTIELVRGVPLVTVLFMASLLVPLLEPRLAGVDNVVRALVGITFFSAAYLAEIVRGGLQAIPYGQVEAARALGMPGWQITLLITLPQALRIVIPAIMGQFVSVFKDTSLVAIIGLIDLLGISRTVIQQAEYIGLQRESLFFISVIYFILSYLMSWVSRRLERTGSGAVRRA